MITLSRRGTTGLLLSVAFVCGFAGPGFAQSSPTGGLPEVHGTLVAQKAEKAGAVSHPNGTAAPVAADEAAVKSVDLNAGLFVVRVGGADTEAKTSGKIHAAAAKLRANGGNVYALAGNTDGIVAATGVAKVGGRIFLTAGDGGSVMVSQKAVMRTASKGTKAKSPTIRVAVRKPTVPGTLDTKADAGG